MPRKTLADRNAEYYNQSSRYWSMFQEKLKAVTTYAEARALAQQTPRLDAPGRKFHSNLSFFLSEFVMPSESNPDERQLYRELMRRMNSSGNLKSGILEAFERNNPPED